MSGVSEAGAELSVDRRYRYSLWRRCFPGSPLVVIGLNPSTADETEDDQTIRRCKSYAGQLGAKGGLIVVNLYAYRERDPDGVWFLERWTERAAVEHPDEVGRNDRAILAAAVGAHLVIAAWGDFSWARQRARDVAALLERHGVKLHALGVTATGAPRHPSRAPNGLVPQPWEPS